jgi:hypothetical protein
MDYRLFSAATSPGFHRRSDSCIVTPAMCRGFFNVFLNLIDRVYRAMEAQ